MRCDVKAGPIVDRHPFSCSSDNRSRHFRFLSIGKFAFDKK
jgi:hypothetical protein